MQSGCGGLPGDFNSRLFVSQFYMLTVMQPPKAHLESGKTLKGSFVLVRSHNFPRWVLTIFIQHWVVFVLFLKELSSKISMHQGGPIGLFSLLFFCFFLITQVLFGKLEFLFSHETSVVFGF